MPRAAAWALKCASWSLLPSTSPIQVRSRPGSRRLTAPKTAAMTSPVLLATLAVRYLFPAFGMPAGTCAGCSPPGSGTMSAAVRGTGSQSKTAPASAIRLWVLTSPCDSRPACLGTAAAAARAAAGRSESGRILMPLPSASSTSTRRSPAAGAGTLWPRAKLAASAAAARMIRDACRVPIRTPVSRNTCPHAAWMDIRPAASASLSHSPAENLPGGRLSCSSSRCTFGTPRRPLR